MGGAFSLYPNHIFLSEKEHKGQRFTPKKRTVPVSCFESGIDHIVYQLCGLTKKEIKLCMPQGRVTDIRYCKSRWFL